MKKSVYLVMALILAAVLAFAGCAPTEPSPSPSVQPSDSAEVSPSESAPVEPSDSGTNAGDKPMKFAFSGSELANPWVALVKDGFEAACKELNIEFVSLNAGSDVDQQVADIENVIEGGYNGLVFNPIDGNALETVLNSATQDGMASVTVAQTASAATAGIVLDDYAYGCIIAQNAVDWINENLDGKGQVAVLAEDNIESSIKRGDAIVDTIEKGCPDVEIVARQHANTPELGLSVTENLLLQYPDLDVIVCCNDSGGIGAYQAMQNAGIKGDDKGVFSGDATDEVLGYMKEEGSIYRGTADLHPYESGYDAVKMAVKYLTEGFPAQQETVPLAMEPVTQEDVISGKYSK